MTEASQNENLEVDKSGLYKLVSAVEAQEDLNGMPGGYWTNKCRQADLLVTWLERQHGIQAINAVGQQLMDAYVVARSIRTDTGKEVVEPQSIKLSLSPHSLNGLLVTSVAAAHMTDAAAAVHKTVRAAAYRKKLQSFVRIVDLSIVALHNNQGPHSTHWVVTFQFCQVPEAESWPMLNDTDGSVLEKPTRVVKGYEFFRWGPMSDVVLSMKVAATVEGDPDEDGEGWDDVDETEDLSEVSAFEEEARQVADAAYRAEAAEIHAARMKEIRAQQEAEDEDDESYETEPEEDSDEDLDGEFGYELPDLTKAAIKINPVPLDPHGDMINQVGLNFGAAMGVRLAEALDPETLARLKEKAQEPIIYKEKLDDGA